jgi:UDP-N-acetylglucosamine 2-epimerase (non-hydrolysing)
MIKVLSIFGTRPEAIKMAPLVKALERHEAFESKVCVTAQHREMLDQVLKIFDITPDYDLDIMKNRQTLTDITTNALIGLETVIREVQPDIVLVHGDTTTTFAGSLAAFYNQIKVGHVEAGLRTFNKYFPFPEELNRKLTGVIADLHFAPTDNAKINLLREGIDAEGIFITGNTAIDALKTTVNKDFQFYSPLLQELDYQNKRIIAVTAHRRENLGEPLQNICKALKYIAEKYEDVEVVYAVHKNPAVREIANEILGNCQRIHLLEPLDAEEMHNLMDRSYLVLTDSGGLQEEAPSLGKPVLVLRNETERPEAIEFGTLKLAGTDMDNIIKLAEELLNDKAEYKKMANAVNPYGDGTASQRIIESLLYHFGEIQTRPADFEAKVRS